MKFLERDGIKIGSVRKIPKKKIPEPNLPKYRRNKQMQIVIKLIEKNKTKIYFFEFEKHKNALQFYNQIRAFRYRRGFPRTIHKKDNKIYFKGE